MTFSRRAFLVAAVGVAVLPNHHRPNHRGKPTPTPGLTGPGFVVGQSLVGGPDVVGGIV